MASYHEMDGEASCRRHGEIIQPSWRGLQTRISYFKTASLNMDDGCRWLAHRRVPVGQSAAAAAQDGAGIAGGRGLHGKLPPCTAGLRCSQAICIVHMANARRQESSRPG